MITMIEAKLIMNADDYGATTYINNGILEGIQQGIINSVSVFVTYLEVDNTLEGQEAELIKLMEVVKRAEQRVEIGLHLSLNVGKALTHDKNKIRLLLKPSRGKKGSRVPNPYLRSLERINVTEEYCRQARIEMEAQILYLREFLAQYGKKVDHINHHVGFVTFNSKLWATFVDIAKKYDLAVRSPIGYTQRAETYWKTGFFIGVKDQAIKKMTKKIARNFGRFKRYQIIDSVRDFLFRRKELMEARFEYAREQGVCMPMTFNDNYYNEATARKALNFLRSFEDGEIKEFMLHPSLYQPTYTLPQGFAKGSVRHRYRELKVILEKEFIQNGQVVKLSDVIKGQSTIVSSDGSKEISFELINYGDLAKHSY